MVRPQPSLNSGYLHPLLPLPGTLPTWPGYLSSWVCSLEISLQEVSTAASPPRSPGSCLSPVIPVSCDPWDHSTPPTASWSPGCWGFRHPHPGLGAPQGQRTHLACSQLPPQSRAPCFVQRRCSLKTGVIKKCEGEGRGGETGREKKKTGKESHRHPHPRHLRSAHFFVTTTSFCCFPSLVLIRFEISLFITREPHLPYSPAPTAGLAHSRCPKYID